MIPSSWYRIITLRCCLRWCGKNCPTRPSSCSGTFPGPTPESYGICPWRREISKDSWAAASSGFTREARQPFSVLYRSYLEARIDRDSSTVSYGGRLTAVNPTRFPSSGRRAGWKTNGRAGLSGTSASDMRWALTAGGDRCRSVGLHQGDHRTVSRGRTICLNCSRNGSAKFSFIQIAAPSRTIIDQYQHFHDQVYAWRNASINALAARGTSRLC